MIRRPHRNSKECLSMGSGFREKPRKVPCNERNNRQTCNTCCSSLQAGQDDRHPATYLLCLSVSPAQNGGIRSFHFSSLLLMRLQSAVSSPPSSFCLEIPDPGSRLVQAHATQGDMGHFSLPGKEDGVRGNLLKGFQGMEEEGSLRYRLYRYCVPAITEEDQKIMHANHRQWARRAGWRPEQGAAVLSRGP